MRAGSKIENYEEVYRLREEGKPWKYISEKIGLSETRVILIYKTWKQELLLKETQNEKSDL